jgi:hypothetical protein
MATVSREVIPVDIAGVSSSLPVTPIKSTLTTVTRVSSSTSNTVLASGYANRLGLSVHNDSAQDLYLKLGASAGATSWTIKMAAQGYFEVPAGYTGQVDGFWAAADGYAFVTELR